MIKKIRQYIREKFTHTLYESTLGLLQKTRQVKEKYHLCNKKRNIVIFGTPNHGNLGDYAIGIAEKKLFSQYAPNDNIFDVNMADFGTEISALKKVLKKQDILILTGGGNLGNQYMDDEKIRRTVITLFPKNRIVLFPQTMYFTPDKEGEKEKRKTAEIYNAHRDLWMAARDEKTYKDMQVLFQNRLFLLPDVVLTWGTLPQTERKGALLVLRSDLESVISIKQKNELISLLQKEFGNVREVDTVLADGTSMKTYESELEKKWMQFCSSEIVVTDRLHGMIFAAIAQTPCLVLQNYNHKLQETSKWLSNLEYIKQMSDWSTLKVCIQDLKKRQKCYYNENSVLKQYQAFLREVGIFESGISK